MALRRLARRRSGAGLWLDGHTREAPGAGLAFHPWGHGTLDAVRGIPGVLRKWVGWGLAGLVLGAGGAWAQEGEESVAEVELVAPGPMLLSPWRDAALDGPHVWMRQSLWAGPWAMAWRESVADFVVPYPHPEAVMYVTAPDARLLAEPSPAALRVGSFTPFAPVSVGHSKPWLPEGFVAVFDKGRVTGFLPRAALSGTRPPVERLLAASRAALEGLEVARAQQLAWAAQALYPEHAGARALVKALEFNDDAWMPPELASPGGALPAPGAHVTPGATLYVGSPSLPLLRRRALMGAAPEEWLPINTAVLVLDVDGGWARVREARLESRVWHVGRDGDIQWRSLPEDEGVAAEEGVGREGYVLARYLDAAPVDPQALRELARSLGTKGSREEALAMLERASAAEPWSPEAQRALFESAVKLGRVEVVSRAAWALAALENAEEEVAVDEGAEVFAGPPGTPRLETKLYYGCGGDMFRAEVFAEHDQAVQEELQNGTSALPTSICLEDVDAEPPPPSEHHVACPEDERSDDEADTPERRARLDREEAAARKEYTETLLPAFERKLKRLRERFPLGPYFCVSVTHSGSRPRVNLRVQFYELPPSEVEACAEHPKVLRHGSDSLRVGEMVIPYLAAGMKTDVCFEVPRYEDMNYGVVLAPDLEAAKAFVRRVAQAREAVALGEEEGAEERLAATFSSLPHAARSTAVTRECLESCY